MADSLDTQTVVVKSVIIPKGAGERGCKPLDKNSPSAIRHHSTAGSSMSTP